MWFIFPQLRALGRSSTALRYGLQDLNDARGYFSHPVLGVRLKECTQLVLRHHDKSALEILHHPDNLKFRSCMTLFQVAAPQEPVLRRRWISSSRGMQTPWPSSCLTGCPCEAAIYALVDGNRSM